MVDVPTANHQGRNGYVGSFPSAIMNYSTSIYGFQTEVAELPDDNMIDYGVRAADTEMYLNSSESRPSLGSSNIIHAPSTNMLEATPFGSLTTQIQPTFHSTSEISPFRGSSSSHPTPNSTTSASPFAMFNSSNQSTFNAASILPAMRTVSPSPFSMQQPTESASKFNPFAAQTINQSAINPNPFAPHTEPKETLGLYSSQVQKATENGLSANESKSAFSQTPPTSINSASNPFRKDTAENRPISGDVTVKSVSRQTRFSESTDIGTLYQQAVEERTERRARLIKEGSIDNPAVPKYLDQAIKFHGTCNSMCPEFECLQRRYQKMVDSFELDSDGNPDQSLFAKSFHRPAAGMDAPLPEDVRTPKALVDTLRYLVFEIVMNTPWHECHGFVRDRTRSIRQDFTYQNYEGEEAVICTEIIARFHILALHMMSGQPDNQEYMELEQLDKSLTTLGFIYLDGQIPDADENRKVFPNEPEFRAYTILRHLRDRYVEKDDIRKWPTEVVYSDRVQHALRIYQAVQRYDRATNYGFHAQHYVKTFFELVKSKETDFITACLLQVYFPEIRRFSLKIMAENYMKTSKMTSVEFIKDFLCYESVEQAEHEIRHYGLSIAEHSADGVPFFYLIPGKGSFDVDAPKIRTRPNPSLLEPKREPGKSLADILWGSEHKIVTCRSLSFKDADALVNGNCQRSEAYHQFGEGETYFELDEAKAGEYDSFNKYGWPSETVVPDSAFRMEGRCTSIPLFNQMAIPVYPTANASDVFEDPAKTSKSVFSTDDSTNVSANLIAMKHRSTFFKENTGEVRGTSITTFSDKPESKFSSASTSTNIAPAFVGQSISNPFVFAQHKALISFPTTVNSPDGSTFQRENQPLSFSNLSATPSQPGISNEFGEKQLFLGGEDALSDDEEVEPFSVPASQTSWTSFLPSKVESSSSKPSATSLFDQKTEFPSTFQFTNPTLTQPTAKNPPPLEAPSMQQVPTFKNATDNIFQENKEPPTITFKARESMSGSLATTSGQRDESIVREAIKREEASVSEAREREETIAREVCEREEAIVKEAYEREEAMEKKAQGIFNRRLIEKYFYLHVEKARRQKRRTDRVLRKKHRTAYAEDPQWWPIIKDGALYKDSAQKVSQLVFKNAELEQSIPEIVHLALAESKISHTTYRLLLHNNDRCGQSEYWFQQKFFGTQKEISIANPETGNEFHAQLTVTEEEAPEVGFLVFGCSSDFSLSNKERFATDCDNLHFIVDHLTQNLTFSKLAIMVICYRSPVDDEPADPNGLDSSRTLGKARRERIELIKNALNFSSFPDTVVGKKVVLVETLRDLDLSHELRTFADDYVLETVNPRYSGQNPSGGTTRKVKQAIRASKRKMRGEPDIGDSPGITHKVEGKPRPTAQEKRKRVMEVSPRTLIPSRVVDTPPSSTKRVRDPGLQDTPLKRYCRKKQEQGILDGAKMRAKTLIGFSGFSMVLQSPPTASNTDPSPPPPTATPKATNTDTKLKDRIDKVIEDADKTSAKILKFFAEHESSS